MLRVVEEDHTISGGIGDLCVSLQIDVVVARTAAEFSRLLVARNPIAVVAAVDTRDQDGYHVLMEVSERERTLPVMLITGSDPAMMGAAEAVIELWRLDSVQICAHLPSVGQLAEFLCDSVRRRVEHRAEQTAMQRADEPSRFTVLGRASVPVEGLA